jgi:hypothetical protein
VRRLLGLLVSVVGVSKVERRRFIRDDGEGDCDGREVRRASVLCRVGLGPSRTREAMS